MAKTAQIGDMTGSEGAGGTIGDKHLLTLKGSSSLGHGEVNMSVFSTMFHYCYQVGMNPNQQAVGMLV